MAHMSAAEPKKIKIFLVIPDSMTISLGSVWFRRPVVPYLATV